MERDLREQALATVREQGMLAGTETVVVGFSGGPDSTALLHFLATQFPGLILIPVHIHHGLRPAAEAEAAAAVAFCQGLGLGCRVVRADAKAEAAQRGRGLEEAGRALRYRVFDQVLRETGAERLALAHTQNDQAETLLLWLCRGAGLSGLTGMPPVRLPLIRPLLDCSREQVLRYCAAHSLAYSLDESNESPDFTRNRVRRLLAGLTAQINPQAVAHLAQTAALVREDEACLEALAQAAYEKSGLDRANLLAAPLGLRRRMVRLAWREATGGTQDLSARHTADILGLLDKQPGRGVDLPGGFRAEGGFTSLHLMEKQAAEPFCLELVAEKPVALPQGGDWVLFTKKSQKIQKNGYTLPVDYDTITGCLQCRSWRPGDRLLWPGHHRTVKELFGEKRVPRWLRGAWPLVACPDGVIWVPGLWASPLVAPQSGSRAQGLLFLGGGKTFERTSTYVDYERRNSGPGPGTGQAD